MTADGLFRGDLTLSIPNGEEESRELSENVKSASGWDDSE